MPHIIEVSDLTAGYDGRSVINNVDLTIGRGDFVGIIGPNGGGKTTLVKSIIGLLKPLGGEVRMYDNRGARVAHLAMGYLPQRKDIDVLFPITVEEVVTSGLMSQLGWWRRPTMTQRRRVADVLEQVGLTAQRRKPIGELSGGQVQRALVGRAIVRRPEIVVLDEPNSYLDMAFEQQLYALLRDLNADGTTILMVSHEMASLTSLVTRVVSVEGRVVEGSCDCPYHHAH